MNKKLGVGFGPHLTLDCYNCNDSKLRDLNFILKFLDDLTKEVDMTKIVDPFAISYPGNPNSFDNGGVSAVVLISESHISIHTFPSNNGYMNLDIFSCKGFDVKKAVNFVIKNFEVKKFEKNLFMRGREFPKNIEATKEIIHNDRLDLETKKVKA